MKEPRGFQGLPACHVIKMYNLHPSDSSSLKQTSGRRLLWNSPLRELFSCIDCAAHSGSWTLLFVDMKSLLYKNYIIDNQSWCESHSTLGRPGSCFWQSIPMGETAFVSNSWCLLKLDNQTFGGGWWLQHRDCISKSTFVYRCMTDKTLDSLELSWCGHDWVMVRGSTRFKQTLRDLCNSTIWPSSNMSTCRNPLCPWKIKRWYMCLTHWDGKQVSVPNRHAWKSDMKVVVFIQTTVWNTVKDD